MTISSGSQPCTADKVDALCKSASNDSADYVSFKSFLGIKDQPEEGESRSTGFSKVKDSSEKVKDEDGECKKLLNSTEASSSHVRFRPTRGKERRGSTLKELEDSIHSLIKK